jgi:hypothetical protein
MSALRHNAPLLPLDDVLFRGKQRKTAPHDFVLEALGALSPGTRPMFGCVAVYVEEQIVLILRDRREETADNGVWLATTEVHHESLRREFPNMRSIQMFGNKVTGWQVLPVDAPDFEEATLRACELIAAKDPRIGKIPKARRSSASGVGKAANSPKRAQAQKERREKSR